ncbi:MAG: hypothetical protein GY796_01730 [Chloroflexi bacterium]|nr:hypothetical protein [Chloroflexota bacterium]
MNIHFEYDHQYLPPAPIIEITVDGYSQSVEPLVIRAMIDSGADGTMIPIQVLAKIEATYTDSVRMSGITGGNEQRDRNRVRIQATL